LSSQEPQGSKGARRKASAEQRFWAIMRALDRWSRTKSPGDKAELDALIAEAKQDEGGEAEWP